MQHQSILQNYNQERHEFGGSGGGTTPPKPLAPPPIPATPQAASTAPTAQQTQAVDQRLFAPQGFQSTVLSANTNTDQGVTKKALLGG